MNIVLTVYTPYGGIKTTKAADFQRLFCTPAGGRTLDTLIKSQVLYQLSYGSIVLTTLNLSVCGCKSTTFFRSHNAFLWKKFNDYYK